jgi:hypothetical protein
MTGRELVTATLKKLGAIAPGESLDATEANDALAELNRMISAWSTEGLLIFTPTRESVALTPGTAAYTMGTSGTYSSTRAQRILEVLIRDETQATVVEYPVEIINLSQWAAIPAKGTQSSIPTHAYADGGFPRETVNLYPTPSTAHKLVIYSEKPLSSISSLDTSISLPPGYEDTLIYNLALRLSPDYGKTLSDQVIILATEGKANLKRANRKTPVLEIEPALLPSTRSGWDIFRGDG